MKIDSCEFFPKARIEGIICKDLDNEVLVYDRQSDRAHCLNQTAAAIWRLCDGRRPVQEIATELGKAASAGQPRPHERLAHNEREVRTQTADINLKIVWIALAQLGRSQLLEADTTKKKLPSAALSGLVQLSRREVLRWIGLSGASALPIVASMTAPTAVEAAVSCQHHCEPCASPIDCCGTCSTTVSGCPGSPRCM